jgi:hypothetical protein
MRPPAQAGVAVFFEGLELRMLIVWLCASPLITIMESLARSSLRATGRYVLRQNSGRHIRSFSSMLSYPPTHNAMPAKPPASALPMPFVTETVVCAITASCPPEHG